MLARPPRWLLFGSIGLTVLLIGPPAVAVANGQGTTWYSWKPAR